MGDPVVVIGGGIIGSAIAHELQTNGTDTVLVERDLEPQGASAFSFASLSAFDEPQQDVYLLKSHGMVEWRRWAKVFGDEFGVRFGGELRWAETAESGRHLQSLMDRAKTRGYPVRAIPGRQIGELEPSSRPRAVETASWAPGDGQADPVRAIDILKRAFSNSGGSLLLGRAGVIVDDQGIGVRIGDDRLDASVVVVAMGAETNALLERMGWHVPMDPSPGLLCVTERVEPFMNGTVYVYPDCGAAIHLRQLSDGKVVIGERAQDEVAKKPTVEHARSLLRSARRFFPALEETEVAHFTVEWRPMPRDKMPVVGPVPGLPSLYVATGHSGVTIAPALARFIAQEIEGSEVELLDPFRPARFGAHTADAYKSIEDAFAALSGSDVYLG